MTGFLACASRYTGKERDLESGLDDFGARYYASTMGRFMSPDPVLISPELTNPQSWNKYSYTFNNPLTLIDPDGKWPTPTHHQINQDVFSGLVGAHGVSVINKASDYVDRIPGGQSPENSYQHFMINGQSLYGTGMADEKQAAGYAASYNFIFGEIGKAVDIQLAYEAKGGTGNSDDALTHFGYAIHTVEDGTSPEHRGLQPWYGMSGWKTGLEHKRTEERSALGQTPSDEEALYEARVQAAAYWNYYQGQLKDRRKKQHHPELPQ